MSAQGIPASYTELAPEAAQIAVEGIPDLLAGDRKRAEALYRQHLFCKNGCGPTMEQSYGGAQFAFADPDWLIPRNLMKCHICGFVMNPFDGMIVELGDSNKALHGNVPIIGANKQK